LKTRGQIEASISEAIVKFEKEYMGRGPLETKTYIVDDIVLVRLKGVITRAEHHLATSGDGERGRDLIKQTRMELIEKARPLLETVIQSIVGEAVLSLHTDISTRTGERVIIFTLKNVPTTDNGMT
jgi:uncharacterized protein YbcI